jgi:hypothetical protein
MTDNIETSGRPTYAAIAALIKTNFLTVMKGLFLYSLTYTLLISVIAALFVTINYLIEIFMPNSIPTRVASTAVHSIAILIAAAMLVSALSSSVLKVYRQEEGALTVDNRVLIRMVGLFALFVFLAIAIGVACIGLATYLADFTSNREQTILIGSAVQVFLTSLLAMSLVFAPFLIVDGAGLSDALNSSTKLLSQRFFWLLPLLLLALLTHWFFGFGFAILGAAYLSLKEGYNATAKSSARDLAVATQTD